MAKGNHLVTIWETEWDRFRKTMPRTPSDENQIPSRDPVPKD